MIIFAVQNTKFKHQEKKRLKNGYKIELWQKNSHREAKTTHNGIMI